MMTKRAVVFSIVTLVILSALLGFAKVYHQTHVDIERSSSQTFYGEQMRNFEEDIFGNIYRDLMDVQSINVERTSATVTINMTQSLNATDNNYQQIFANYKSFVEKNYSGNNYNYSLREFDNSFNITPYGARYTVDSGKLYIYTADINNLQNITVSVTVDTLLVKTQASIPDDDKNDAFKKPIAIYYYREDGTLIDSLTDRVQNPYENNAPFRQTFKDVPNQDVIEIDVAYGTYNSIPGVLQVYLHNANTNYNIAGNTSIQLNYNQGREVRVIGGELTMNTAIDALSRTTRHIVARE